MYLDKSIVPCKGKSFKVPTLEEIREKRKKGLVLFMLSVYGDESYDKHRERVYAVAGIMGTQEEWDTLEIAWKKRTGGKVFHPTDVEAGRRDWKRVSDEDRHKVVYDLTQLLIKSKMLGFGVAMDLQGYRIYFPNSSKNMPYYRCFEPVIRRFSWFAAHHNPPEIAECIFDINADIEHNAAYLYDNLFKLPEWKDGRYIGKKLSFATKEEVGIQAACLYAREVMKLLDHELIPPRERKRPILASMDALLKTRRFTFEFHLEKYFEKLRIESLNTLEKDQQAYHEWRKRYRLQDNDTNKLRYLHYVESTKGGKP